MNVAQAHYRAMLSRLVDAYDRISEESLGIGDPEFHEIEDPTLRRHRRFPLSKPNP